MSVGRFIFMCEPEHFEVACDAANYLLENPQHKSAMTSQTDGDGRPLVSMFANRLKKSISVRQVRP